MLQIVIKIVFMTVNNDNVTDSNKNSVNDVNNNNDKDKNNCNGNRYCEIHISIYKFENKEGV